MLNLDIQYLFHKLLMKIIDINVTRTQLYQHFAGDYVHQVVPYNQINDTCIFVTFCYES